MNRNNDKLLSRAEKFVENSETLSNTVRDIATSKNKQVQASFEQQIDAIEYWKNEIQDKFVCVTGNINKLDNCKSKLTETFETLGEPLTVVLTCLYHRNARVDIEPSFDNTDKELINERKLIEKTKTRLERYTNHAISLLQKGNSASYLLEKDLMNKIYAATVDSRCSKFSAESLVLKNISTQSAAFSTRKTLNSEIWVKKIGKNLQLGDEFVKNSQDLSSSVKNYLAEAENELLKQASVVDQVFQAELQQNKATLQELQSYHDKVELQINVIEKERDKLEETLKDMEYPLRIAREKLSFRSKRPGVECVEDDLQVSLKSEIEVIEKNRKIIMVKLCEERDLMRDLAKSKLSLERDIKVKRNTIEIDEEFCIPLHNKNNKSYLT